MVNVEDEHWENDSGFKILLKINFDNGVNDLSSIDVGKLKFWIFFKRKGTCDVFHSYFFNYYNLFLFPFLCSRKIVLKSRHILSVPMLSTEIESKSLLCLRFKCRYFRVHQQFPTMFVYLSKKKKYCFQMW